MPVLVIAVGGPKGVGKTTVLEKIVKQQPEWQLIKVSQELLYLADNAWSDLLVEQKDEIRKIFVQKLLKNLPENLILDLHYIDLREGAEKCIQPKELINICTHFVVFLAPAELILKRRKKRDKDRFKELNLAEIKQESMAEFKMAKKLAKENKKPFLIYCNI